MALKVFINEKGLATFKCPACSHTQTKSIGSFDKIARVKKIKCSCPCGNIFTAILEKRAFYRKEANFVGRYIYRPPDGLEMRGALQVLDVSQSGLLFKTNLKHDLSVGMKITVEFYLDEERNILITKEGTVRRIIEKKVGIKFLTAEHYDQLGKFLMH